MDDIYKEAHKMAKSIYEEYKDVDYKFQFQLCLSYLSDKKNNERIEEILAEVKVNEEEARILEKVEFYYKNFFDSEENLKFRLWQRQDKRRVYLSASYIVNKPYIDLISNKLFDKNEIKKF
ncbi:hypothetical protein [Terrisporobacter vanillatitrophus]|uniref:hypothetical protein n=1 Tax=Terrisporobacter vanillatitrophus TaxID=3058402 RepID=UPI003366EE3E